MLAEVARNAMTDRRRKHERGRHPQILAAFGGTVNPTNDENTSTIVLDCPDGLLASVDAQAQCNSCQPDLSCVAVDFPVLCPEQLPNGIQGEPYESSATFNLPPSVTDPGSGLEATLLTVTISSVTGLPFGLEFSPNNPNGVYQPQDGEYYGCAVVCGTPLVSGSFFVDINVTVLCLPLASSRQ